MFEVAAPKIWEQGRARFEELSSPMYPPITTRPQRSLPATSFAGHQTMLALVLSLLAVAPCVALLSAELPESMCALVSTRPSPLGPSKGRWNFKLVEKPLPSPGSGEVLVEVQASSVNPVDFKLATFESGPLGIDYAGTVAAAGENCSHLNVGQQVYGTSRGTFAQFAVAVCNKLGTRETRSKLPLEDHATLPSPHRLHNGVDTIMTFPTIR